MSEGTATSQVCSSRSFTFEYAQATVAPPLTTRSTRITPITFSAVFHHTRFFTAGVGSVDGFAVSAFDMSTPHWRASRAHPRRLRGSRIGGTEVKPQRPHVRRRTDVLDPT